MSGAKDEKTASVKKWQKPRYAKPGAASKKSVPKKSQQNPLKVATEQSLLAGSTVVPVEREFVGRLQAIARKGLSTEAVEELGRMQATGVTPTETHYVLAVKACGIAKDPTRMMEIFAAMRQAGVPPSTVTYGALITGFGRCGDPDNAIQAYRRMIDVDGLFPNAVVMEQTMRALQDAQQYRRVVAAFHEFAAHDVPPTTYAKNMLIRAHSNMGQLAKALEVLRAMPGEGTPPTEQTYIAYGSGLRHAEDPRQAVDETLTLMRSRAGGRVEPTDAVFAVLALALRNSPEDAVKFLESRRADKRPGSPEERRAYIRVLRQGGRWSELFSFLHEAQERKGLFLHPNEVPAYVEAAYVCKRWDAIEAHIAATAEYYSRPKSERRVARRGEAPSKFDLYLTQMLVGKLSRAGKWSLLRTSLSCAVQARVVADDQLKGTCVKAANAFAEFTDQRSRGKEVASAACPIAALASVLGAEPARPATGVTDSQ